MQAACVVEELGITFKYTAPGTPQSNGTVEQSCATLYGQVRAMMNHAHFSHKARNDLWAACGATATKIESILVDQRNEKSPYELFYKISPGYEQNLRVFGEIGVITNHANKKVRSKLENRGTTCVFVVYATNHAGDVYRMFNVTT